MKLFLILLIWAFLAVVWFPMAVLVLILWPFIWLLSIPFRVVGIAAQAFLAFVRALLFLPARMLGYHEGA
jgi:hypothetical protein